VPGLEARRGTQGIVAAFALHPSRLRVPGLEARRDTQGIVAAGHSLIRVAARTPLVPGPAGNKLRQGRVAPRALGGVVAVAILVVGAKTTTHQYDCARLLSTFLRVYTEPASSLRLASS
jgi:hypothetical protein